MSKRIITENLNEEFRTIRAGVGSPEGKILAEKKKEQVRKTRRLRMASTYGGLGVGASLAPDVIGIEPQYFIPQLENSSLELPRYRQEIISWCDFYYQTNELVGTAVDIHSTLSIADFAISCKDRIIQQEYEDVLERINYTQLLSDIAHEYFRVGNVFPMGNWNENELTWDEFVLIPMLNVELKRTILSGDPKIYLEPNDSLKQVFNDPDLDDELRTLPSEFASRLREGHPVLLDKNRVSHISTKSIAGTLLGVPPLYRCFKTLVYHDKLYRSQEAIADGHITPLRMISLMTPDGLPVTEEEEENFRQQLLQADSDPNYIIITAGQIQDKYIGSAGKIIQTNSEFDMIERKICSGLKINTALLHGEGPTYANAQVYQTMMNFYYLSFRNNLKNWLLRKVFTPIAKARGYYERFNNQDTTNFHIDSSPKRLLLPSIVWRGAGTIDSQSVNIIQDLWKSKKLSTDTFMKMILPDVDPEEEAVKVMREAEMATTISKMAPGISQQLGIEGGEDDLGEGPSGFGGPPGGGLGGPPMPHHPGGPGLGGPKPPGEGGGGEAKEPGERKGPPTKENTPKKVPLMNKPPSGAGVMPPEGHGKIVKHFKREIPTGRELTAEKAAKMAAWLETPRDEEEFDEIKSTRRR